MKMSEENFVIERNYNAPIERVWAAISDNAEMKKWYFDLPEFRAEPGFQFEFTGGPSPEKQYRHLCEVTEAIPEKKLTYSWRYDGYEGNSFVTFELFPKEGGTLLRLTHAGLETFPESNPDLAKTNFAEGWTEIIGSSLKNFLEPDKGSEAISDSEIFSARIFDYPPKALFNAFADPQKLAQWWGPAGFTNTFEEFDFRPGGFWRFTMHGPDGADYINESQFIEITEPQRIIFMHLRTMHKFKMTMTFEAIKGNKTRLSWRQEFETAEECERVMKFAGPANEENFDRLEAILSEKAA
jgi:uncharacterized protein YndB with AHSA1/START domain